MDSSYFDAGFACLSDALSGLRDAFHSSSLKLPASQVAQPEAASSLRILTINDVYKPDRFAAVRTLSQQLSGPNVTKLVLPGDFLGASQFAVKHRGESVVEILNAMGIEYCTLGNHEFDFGSERTAELMDKSKFRWLGSNVRNPDGSLFHTVVDVDVFSVPLQNKDKVKVGVFGLCTQATPELSSPGPGVVFQSAVEHAVRCVSKLEEQGCEVIVALTHISLAQDKEVAEACPSIRVILGGHDHDPYFLKHRNAVIMKCGQNADHMGVLDLNFERTGTGIDVTFSVQMISTQNAQADQGILDIANRWKALNGANGKPLCKVGDVALSTRSQELRSRENAFGCVVADAIRKSYSEQGCQLAIQNGGFIRQDALYPAHTTLTTSDVKEEMPFPRTPILLKLSGAALRQGLEEMLAFAPVPAGSFPQLSKGFRVEYDPQAPRLKKILNIEINGVALDRSKDYLVAISDFYALKPGDGVTTFSTGKVVASHEKLISDVVVEYLGGIGIVKGEPPGRLIVTGSIK